MSPILPTVSWADLAAGILKPDDPGRLEVGGTKLILKKFVPAKNKF
jgi:hypothetical protein